VRAAAFDARLNEVATLAEERKLAQQAGLWARRMVESREEAFQLANKLIAKAQAMLDYPLAQTTSADGKTTVKPARWNFSDAARMADVAARLKQLATGLPTERLEHSGPDGAPLVSLTTQVNVSAIQARVAAAVEAQEKVDVFLEHGIMKVPGGDGGVSLEQPTLEQTTNGDDDTHGGEGDSRAA
jgi:hypothetical protein